MKHRDRVVRLMALGALALPAACRPETEAAAPYTVRDSAGIRLVEYAGVPEPTRRMELSAEPMWRHGDDEDEYAFSLPFLGALQADGGAVVADMGSSEVVRVGADGALVGVLARKGEGPGEVGRVVGLEVLGQDAILVQDAANGQLMWFGDGRLSRSVALTGYDLGYALRTVGVAPDGTPLMITAAYRSDEGERWIQGSMVRLDTATVTPDTLGTYDMAMVRTREGPNNAFAPSGEVRVAGGGFVVTRSDRPEVLWTDARGVPKQLVRWVPELAYPTRADLDRWTDRMRLDLVRLNPQMPEARLESFIEEQVARFEIEPDVPLPLFMLPIGDDAGGVWLGEYAPWAYQDGLGTYSVIAPDGIWVGSVRMPPRFRVLDVAGDRVLGVLKDELDVESLAVFRITTGPTGGADG